MITRFANLSNGLLLADSIEEPFGFVRIQSTACEQKRWAHIIVDLDHTFLIPVSIGLQVTIYDMGARKRTSRAIYQGVPWIRYALARAWGIPYESFAMVKHHNVKGYFDKMYAAAFPLFESKLRYYLRFEPRIIDIATHCESTNLDSKEHQIAAARSLAYRKPVCGLAA